MPNPLSRIAPNPGCYISSQIIFERQPNLALAMMQVISSWICAEVMIVTLLIDLLGENARPAVDEAIKCRSAKRQREILLKEACNKLPEEGIEAIAALLSMFKEDSSRRNKLVHWRSGISNRVPDGIVLVNPEVEWRMALANEEFDRQCREARDRGDWDFFKTAERPRHTLSHMWVYKLKDFEDMISCLNELHWCLSFTREMISDYRYNHREEIVSRTLSRLLESPRFQQKISRLRADRQTPQEDSQRKGDAGHAA